MRYVLLTAKCVLCIAATFGGGCDVLLLLFRGLIYVLDKYWNRNEKNTFFSKNLILSIKNRFGAVFKKNICHDRV